REPLDLVRLESQDLSVPVSQRLDLAADLAKLLRKRVRLLAARSLERVGKPTPRRVGGGALPLHLHVDAVEAPGDLLVEALRDHLECARLVDDAEQLQRTPVSVSVSADKLDEAGVLEQEPYDHRLLGSKQTRGCKSDLE